MPIRNATAILIVFVALPAAQAWARDEQAGKVGTERSSDAGTFAFGPTAADGLGGWNLFMGESNADTLAASRQVVFSAAEQALENDGWTVQLSDTTTGQIVTCWKPLHHILVRLFAGSVKARCFVEISSIGSRSSVAFRAGLASKHSLQGNAMLPVARHAYRSAARDWHSEVRQYVSAGIPPAFLASSQKYPATDSFEPPPAREAW